MRVVARAQMSASAWNAFVEVHPHGWWWHTTHWLDYSLAYRPTAVDHSYAVVDDDGAVCAVHPFFEENGEIQLGGEPCPAPILWTDRNGDVIATLKDYAVGIVRSRGLRRVRDRAHPGATMIDVDPSGRDISWDSFVVDLFAAETTRWRDVRKSYRYLIRRAEQERVVVVIGGSDDCDYIKVAQRIHHEAVGYPTRSQRTWDLMGEWMRNGDAILALVSDRTTNELPPAAIKWVGFAYAIRWKQWSYYASGRCVEKDVAHALQWAMMNALAADGRHYYEIGWDVRPWERDDPKVRGIAQFKAGFGGERVRVAAWERVFA